ncbi:hypothetical protein [Azospirillum argentinense]|uniref:hypothetical protein n=1 Tax=Azospirillum argentinense TaxID=2970906 RepID=UPI001FFE33B1|nr:hypothetical protein [Azospirillum argentinense]
MDVARFFRKPSFGHRSGKDLGHAHDDAERNWHALGESAAVTDIVTKPDILQFLDQMHGESSHNA